MKGNICEIIYCEVFQLFFHEMMFALYMGDIFSFIPILAPLLVAHFNIAPVTFVMLPWHGLIIWIYYKSVPLVV